MYHIRVFYADLVFSNTWWWKMCIVWWLNNNLLCIIFQFIYFLVYCVAQFNQLQHCCRWSIKLLLRHMSSSVSVVRWINSSSSRYINIEKTVCALVCAINWICKLKLLCPYCRIVSSRLNNQFTMEREGIPIIISHFGIGSMDNPP
jgi:hypothetical protein